MKKQKRQFATNLKVNTIKELKLIAIEENCNVNDVIESLLSYYKKAEIKKDIYNEKAKENKGCKELQEISKDLFIDNMNALKL